MRPVQMSSEGHWDKQALVCAVEGGGVGWRKSGDLGWEIARLFQADGLPSYNTAESPLTPFVRLTLEPRSLLYCFV